MHNFTTMLSNMPILYLVLFLQFFSIITYTTKATQETHILHLQIANSTCEKTLYQDLCISTLISLPNLTSKPMSQIISSVINNTIYDIILSSSNFKSLRNNHPNLTKLEQGALDDCLTLLYRTITELNTTITHLFRTTITRKPYHHCQTQLSTAMTNLYTCVDGFINSKVNVINEMEENLFNMSHQIGNSLSMLTKILGVDNTTSEKEAFPGYGKMKRGFPSWVSRQDTNLLQAKVNETKFHLIVAKDGSGNFTTIEKAVAAAQNFSKTRFVIYIKAGAYFENVEVIREKTNLMLIGDGIEKTFVKARKNVMDGWSTFQSATVAVDGHGFIAKGITFENLAGPGKQAVALRSSADLSAFYQCSFVGYQDTLYVHSQRQFYRECDIYGTVDFIFGNAAVVLQNCNLYARKPGENQKINLFTAQGRDHPRQNTGISIINSKIAAAADLIPVRSSFKNYLGRPWKKYSRTVLINSYIEDLIDPAGWLELDGTFALDTLYYGEYKNRGPGSSTSARVTWPGYRVITNSAEARQFTVRNFIHDNQWLTSTGIPFFSDLS